MKLIDREPRKIRAYLDRRHGPSREQSRVVQSYRPNVGWSDYAPDSEVKMDWGWVKAARAAGITAVMVKVPDRSILVDFNLDEL